MAVQHIRKHQKHLKIHFSWLLDNEKLATILLAGSLIVLAFLANWQSNNTLSQGLMISAAIVSGFRIAHQAFGALRYRIVGIQLLVTIATLGALWLGENWEAAAVTFLFSFGSYLESRTLGKTRQAISKLMEKPKKAFVWQNGVVVEVEVGEIEKGTRVLIKPGGKIPVDGVVVAGNGVVDQAAITGESLPVNKGEGDSVFTGTVNKSGTMDVIAERVGEDTTFSRIIHMVEEAQEQKSRTEKNLEKFAKFYTPGIVLLSGLMYLLVGDVRLSLTLLVIACPGALVISTPVSMVAGIGNAAARGVLIKGGENLENLSKVDVVAFDKTGTLTHGQAKVVDVNNFGVDMNVLGIAASLEYASEHPLADAILEAQGESVLPAKDVEMIPGEGIKGVVGDTVYYLGNRQLLRHHGITYSSVDGSISSQEKLGRTAVILADDERVLAVISIADTLRSESAETIALLRKLGIKKVVMLSGDNSHTAQAIGDQVGVDEAIGDLLPQDKVRMIQKLQNQGYKVAMVGDGINDGPALATADLGIAMGNRGTDVAMEIADMVIMNDSLAQLAYGFNLSKATIGNMRQNMAFALTVVLTLVIGVLGQKVFMSAGMLVHEISVLLVIVNAMRLLRWKPSIA